MSKTIEPVLLESLEFVMNFMEDATGEKASQGELARALKRYFVLNEIMEHIVMEREWGEG